MRKVLGYLLVLLVALFTTPAFAAGGGSYHLGSGDVVHITVYGHPGLTIDARLGEDGSVNFPLIGEVRLGGDTTFEAEAKIEKELASGGYIKSPQVNLNVTDYKSQQITVLGWVNRPGEYHLDKASRITDALALAGGIMPDGGDLVTLIREKGGKTEYQQINALKLFQPGGSKLNKAVQSDDILFVPKRQVFYIYGQVQRPGSFRLKQHMTVAQALATGGGLTIRGTESGIKIMRQEPNGATHTVTAKLSEQVMPNDVIYVPESLF
ncbi:MAG: polysaccharide export protein EpsE [Acidiferrobacteraceae bacterium]